jgi:hypothetical protein
MKALSVLLLFAATSALAAEHPLADADDWMLAGQSEESLMYVMPDPEAADDAGYVRLLVRFEEAVPFDRRGFRSMSSVEVDEVDCATQRTRILKNTRYSERNLTGAVREEPVAHPEWKSEDKGSFGAAILHAACGGEEENDEGEPPTVA